MQAELLYSLQTAFFPLFYVYYSGISYKLYDKFASQVWCYLVKVLLSELYHRSHACKAMDHFVV